MQKKISFVGFGNVGRSLAILLSRKKTELREKYSLEFKITGIATRNHGMAIDYNGLDIDKILAENIDLNDLNTVSNLNDIYRFIEQCEADVLFENTPVNYETGQPAIDFLRLGLEKGMHVITANKGPVVHGLQELTEVAITNNRKFYFESTVMDGAPIFSLFRENLPAAKLISFKGILNSTSNMILTRVENGEKFEDAVRYCQEIGIAETDPSGDVDGWDSAVKVAALITVLMGVKRKPTEILRTGIRQLSEKEIVEARNNNQRWKLICYAGYQSDELAAWVKPILVNDNSPFYHINGTSSIIEFETDVLGKLTIIEEEPGPFTTAYGLFADFLRAIQLI